MKIKSLKIENLKSYPQANIEFSPRINLLVGENNSGKTTIIRSLLNLQYHAFGKKDIRSNEVSAKTLIQLNNVEETDLLLFLGQQNLDLISLPNKMIDVYWGTAVNQKNTLLEEFLFAPSGKISWNFRESSNDKQAENLPIKFLRFPDDEDRFNFIYPFLAKRKTEYYDSNMSRDQYFKVQETLRNIASRIQRLVNPSHPKHEAFVSACMDILGFKVGVIPVDTEGGNSHEPGIFVTTTSTIPVRSMGEGVINILGFIVTLLCEDNKLILVEELENDMHPSALKKLLSLIKDKAENNQFVISTHSNIVLKYLGATSESKIFLTETTKNQGQNSVPTSIVNAVQNDPVSRMQVLEKLGYEFNDFDLFDAYLILEESSAECLIRDFLIPSFVPELYGRLRTIAAKGVDDLEARVIDFERLFVFVHTTPVYRRRAWIVADGDKAGRDCISSLRTNFKTWPAHHFLTFSKNNFEEFYPDRFQNRVKEAFVLQGEKKRKAKEKLIKDVMKWTLEHRSDADKEFKTSASEVIDLLMQINTELNSGKKKK